MANFYIDGLDRLQVDLATLAAMPDEDILAGMILPAAEILVAAMKEKAATTMNVITGSLLGSVKILTKGVSKRMAYAQVGPNQGKHPHASTGKRKRNAQGGGGGHYSGTNAEIADSLCISIATVKSHIQHLMEKTGFKTRTQLVSEARGLGIVIKDKND